jgi:putative ABC transport system permease protein
MRTVSRDYFEVMGIPLLAGRGFEARDEAASASVLIVNEAFRAQLLGGQDPLGQLVTFTFSGERRFEIVGVAADENVGSLDEVARPVMYSPFGGGSAMFLVVRGRGDVRQLPAAVRREARALEPETVIFAVRTMDELIEASPATFLRRYPLLIVGSFAGLALLLACVGIYGVVSYSVTQRTREFGVRIALGAQRRDVLRLVLDQGLLLTAGGLAVGLLGSLAVARVLKAYLFGVAPGDPWALSATACLLAVVATLACLVPALRATRVDPCQALRHD